MMLYFHGHWIPPGSDSSEICIIHASHSPQFRPSNFPRLLPECTATGTLSKANSSKSWVRFEFYLNDFSSRVPEAFRSAHSNIADSRIRARVFVNFRVPATCPSMSVMRKIFCFQCLSIHQNRKLHWRRSMCSMVHHWRVKFGGGWQISLIIMF